MIKRYGLASLATLLLSLHGLPGDAIAGGHGSNQELAQEVEMLKNMAMFPLSVETAPEKWRAKTLVKFGDVAQENAATPDNSTDTLWLHHESAGARI